VIIACVCTLSCKHSGIGGLAIPKDALIVLHINTPSLTSKLTWKEIQQTSWLQDMQKESRDSLTKKLLDNPEASGIDIKSDMAYFMKKQGRGGYMAFEGKIKDASAFEAMLKSMHSSAVVKKDGDLNYIESGSSNIICWNSDHFYILNDMPMLGMNPFSRGSGSEQEAFNSDSLRKFTKDLIGLKSDDNIDHDDRFASLVKEDGDVHFWVNSDQYMGSMGGGVLSALKVGSLLQGNVGTFTLNFDNGKISIKSKQYFGEEMKKLMEKYKPRNVDAALLSRIPSQDVVGVMAANMDPNTLREFLKASGMDGMANAYLSELNYSVDELINATGGQFLFAVTDLTMKSVQVPSYNYMDTVPVMETRMEPDMNFLFASSVHDRASFEKLMNIFKEKAGEQLIPGKVDYKINNEWFALSNHTEFADKFMAGANNKMPFADKITGHPLGMYIDIQRILKTHTGGLHNAADSAVYDASVALWQNVVMTGGEYSKGNVTSDISINFVDQSTNSLKQLNQYAEKIYQAQKKQRMRYEQANTETMAPDSATTTTIAPSN
jgi:hypothetical protein